MSLYALLNSFPSRLSCFFSSFHFLLKALTLLVHVSFFLILAFAFPFLFPKPFFLPFLFCAFSTLALPLLWKEGLFFFTIPFFTNSLTSSAVIASLAFAACELSIHTFEIPVLRIFAAMRLMLFSFNLSPIFFLIV